MNERALRDDALEAMLEARAGTGAPAGLRRDIVDTVLTDTVAREPRAGSRKRRPGGTTLRLLAVAAVIATIGGAILFAGGRQRTPDPLLDARVPPLPTPRATQTTTPTVAPTPAPSDETGLLPADETPPPCDPGDAVTGSIRPDPAYDGVPSGLANGDLLVAQMHGDDLTASLDRLTIGGDRSTIIESLPADYEPPLRPSPDGALVAIDLPGRGAGAGCGKSVLLVSLADGTIAQPFELGEWDAVTMATWSVDGSTLYAVHEPHERSDGVDGPPMARGSILSWDRRTGAVKELGSPCTDCKVVALFPSRTDGRLVASACDNGCSSNHSIRDRNAVVLGEDGRWRVVVPVIQSAAGLASGIPEVLGLTNGFRLVMDTDQVVVTMALDGSATTEQFPAMGCGGILRSALSPDGSAVASIIDDGVVRLGVLDLASGRWTYESAGVAVGVCPSPIPEVTREVWPAPLWSPDKTRVATIAPGTTNLNIFPADGSASAVLIAHTGSAELAWLPEAP